MKNKWMSKEVQRLLPEDYSCLQCGVAKVFAVYKKSPPEQDWRDLGIVGIAAVIINTNTGATFLRLYEFDNVCGLLDVFHSLFLLFFLSVNSQLNATTKCSLLCFIVLNRSILLLESSSRVKNIQPDSLNMCPTHSRAFLKARRASVSLRISSVKIPQGFLKQIHIIINRIQASLVADLGSFLFLLAENQLPPENPNQSMCHELLEQFPPRPFLPREFLLPFLPQEFLLLSLPYHQSQRIIIKVDHLHSFLQRFLLFPLKV